MDECKTIAALFDFDGVIMDTEPQYTSFWKEMGTKYHPELPHFELKIKGSTLKQVFDHYFKDKLEEQEEITAALNKFEASMEYHYVSGVEQFVLDLRNHKVKTAVVTSSNTEKMKSVYHAHPEIRMMFDYILTAERFKRSKPFPDCYLLGAEVCGVQPDQAIVFEDSFNGLQAGQNAGMKVVGLATTLPENKIEEMADIVIPHFLGMNDESLIRRLRSSRG